jgi:hypothetical protein
MTDSETARFVVDTRMIKVGAGLAGTGLLLASAGMALAAAAVTRAARDWMRERDISPGASAAAKVRQARRASSAGAHAWHGDQHFSANGTGSRPR